MAYAGLREAKIAHAQDGGSRRGPGRARRSWKERGVRGTWEFKPRGLLKGTQARGCAVWGKVGRDGGWRHVGSEKFTNKKLNTTIRVALLEGQAVL